MTSKGRRLPRISLHSLPDEKATQPQFVGVSLYPCVNDWQVLAVTDTLLLNDWKVDKLMQTLEEEMTQGLSRDEENRRKTSLQMENTYVRALLDGSENGDFLALDLGGTNFRVLLCKMRSGKCESISRNYNVPKPKLKGPASEVFDHLAESIFKFLNEENMLDKRLPLGFTFSFPMVQKGLKSGVLVTWTKSFACPDGKGQDAVVLLEEAIARRGDLHVDVVAVLNDTTGTLLAGSYLDHKCYVGLILGTGCNAAYVENARNVDKWQSSENDGGMVAIDIEWGAFGDNGSLDFIKTEFDREVDKHSNHVGSFGFEKLFAGHYIGDLARLVLLSLANEGVVFDGQVGKLDQWGSVTAQHLSNIERDTDEDLRFTKEALCDLELNATSSDDIIVMRFIADVMFLRCAQVVAPAIAVLLRRMGREEVAVAVDGSLYRHHPTLSQDMQNWMTEKAPNVKSWLIDAADGSGRGAAFVAAVAVRLMNG